MMLVRHGGDNDGDDNDNDDVDDDERTDGSEYLAQVSPTINGLVHRPDRRPDHRSHGAEES